MSYAGYALSIKFALDETITLKHSTDAFVVVPRFSTAQESPRYAARINRESFKPNKQYNPISSMLH